MQLNVNGLHHTLITLSINKTKNKFVLIWNGNVEIRTVEIREYLLRVYKVL